MPSYAEQIAIAVVNRIASLPPNPVPIPNLIEFRKDDVVHPGEVPCVIITLGGERPDPALQLQGAGTPEDYGTCGKRYLVGVSVYGACVGDLSTDTGDHPGLVLRIKQAFDVPELDGADTWWGCDLIQSPEWERQEFANGVEVSRFVIDARSEEPRNH
jgi:hypothetical protein